MGLSHTVSGDIASFRTPSRVPIESLKFHFLPKQEGSGDPSPSNVRPITGWTGVNGKRSSKNLAHVVGYSATSVSSSSAQRQTENSYGTTISMVNYISPDTALVVTQASTESPDSPSSYKNGYFEVIVDNLELDKYYDVSFKITNVLSNPLNVSLEDIKTQPPSGSSWSVSEVKNGNILIFRNKKFAVGNNPDRKTFTVRNCGMSFTISEFMVTTANKSDGVFEPYEGSSFPVTFPTDDENKFNTTVENGNIASNGATINISNDRLITNNFIYLAAGVYTLSSQQNYPCAIYVYSEQNESGYISAESLASWNNSPVVFTLTRGRYIRLKWKNDTDTAILPSDLTNIQIKLGTVYLGGYFDPVAGEILCSWRKFKVKDYEWVYKSGNNRFQMQLGSYEKANVTSSGWTNFAISDSYKASNYAGYINLMIASYGNNNIYIRDDTYTDADDFVEAMGEVEIAYELATPIHIPVAPQDIKAFLDHNNFWSDANDITEVTYAVTESKDILATRKLAMDFDHAHHKKVKWNQIQVDGNFQDKDKWAENSYGSISNADGIMTWTCHTQPTQFYHTGFYIKESAGFVAIPYNHKIVIAADIRCSVSTRVRLYGLVSTYGNTYIYSYYNNNVNIPANEWTHLIGFIMDRPETPSSSATDTIIKRFKPTIQGTSGDISTITVGTTLEVKNFMAFDLTQMFGLGNEPSTVAEFEHICEINGIDLTTYQPYDTGSDRWLILP